MTSIKKDFLERPWGCLAYRFSAAKVDQTPAEHRSAKPGLIFLGGFASSMAGSKATYLLSYAQQKGHDCLVFDYQGHGASDGVFTDGTIGGWLEDALAVFDAVTQGPQIVIGSSMGGWLMLLLAQRRTQRVKGLIGLAVSPGFTERLYHDRLNDDERELLARQPVIEKTLGQDTYRISRKLIEEAKNHLIQKKLTYPFPVHLIHGDQDDVVSWAISHELLLDIRSPRLDFSLIQGGDHRLTRPEDLAFLGDVIQRMSD